jgi:hypothetical protein
MKPLKEYHYSVDEDLLTRLISEEKWAEAFELLSEPLHVALYERQSFDLLDDLSIPERLILSFDYVQGQVTQGGFIQLIQNGYISLLLTVIEALQSLNIEKEMAGILDDALKVYVLNQEILGKETSVEEFGKLYEEFKEFEVLDGRFTALLPNTIKSIVQAATEE